MIWIIIGIGVTLWLMSDSGSSRNGSSGTQRPNNTRPAINPQTTYTIYNEGANRAKTRASRIPSSRNYRH